MVTVKKEIEAVIRGVDNQALFLFLITKKMTDPEISPKVLNGVQMGTIDKHLEVLAIQRDLLNISVRLKKAIGEPLSKGRDLDRGTQTKTA